MPIVTFSVPQEIYEKIQSNVLRDESENLAAKRLLLSALGVESLGLVPPDLGDRLEAIESRLNKIEAQLAKVPPDPGPPATAVMIQKLPLPPAGPKTEITLDHSQAATEWGRSPETIKKWARDPNRWPDGWIYDGDKKIWVKEV